MTASRSARARSGLVIAALSASVLGAWACGPEEPEPKVGGVVPPPPTTTQTATTTPPPAEPTLDERRKSAKAAYDAGDWAKAQAELEIIVGKEPTDGPSQAMLADIYASKGDKRAADAYLAATKADGGKDERLALMAAKSLFDQRRYDDVVTVSTAATKANEKSMPLWMYLGLSQQAKLDWAAASETYGKLTTAWPDEPELWADLANAQVGAGKVPEGKKSAKTALDKWTEVRGAKNTKEVKLGKGPDELCSIARAMRRAGDANGALGALGKYTIAKDELAVTIDIEKGFAKHALKDDKTAYQSADKALKLSNNGSAPAHLLLAAVAIDQKHPEIAKAELGVYDMLGGEIAYAWDRKSLEEQMNKPAVEPTPKPAPKKAK